MEVGGGVVEFEVFFVAKEWFTRYVRKIGRVGERSILLLDCICSLL